MFVAQKYNTKCLGLVYDMIAGKGCRSYHDYFIATCAILRMEHCLVEMPEDAVNACLWLSRKQLMAGDISVLLLRPTGEQVLNHARWLKGHSKIHSGMFGWGSPTEFMLDLPRLAGNTIQLALHRLGAVKGHFSWNGHSSKQKYGFDALLTYLMNSTTFSTVNFVQALENIYPSEIGWITTKRGNLFPAIEYCRLNLASIVDAIEQQLSGHISEEDTRTRAGLSGLSSWFFEQFGWGLPPLTQPADMPLLNRLELYSMVCEVDEHTILTIECDLCLKETIVRVSLWAAPQLAASFYLIPGLSYEASLPGAVGIVVESGHVIGRARFVTKYCDCHCKSYVIID
jgi:hypothetical protein